MTVPDGLPTLAQGKHYPGDGQACVMEYVSVLAGEEFTDLPSCTNEWIAVVAQVVNDRIEDAHRHMLVPFIDRLASASDRSEATDILLFGWLRSKSETTWNIGNPDTGTYCTKWSVATAVTEPILSAPFRPWQSYTEDELKERSELSALAGIEFLTEMLDYYDTIAERKEVTQVTPEALAKAKELIEGGLVK